MLVTILARDAWREPARSAGSSAQSSVAGSDSPTLHTRPVVAPHLRLPWQSRTRPRMPRPSVQQIGGRRVTATDRIVVPHRRSCAEGTQHPRAVTYQNW